MQAYISSTQTGNCDDGLGVFSTENRRSLCVMWGAAAYQFVIKGCLISLQFCHIIAKFEQSQLNLVLLCHYLHQCSHSHHPFILQVAPFRL